MGKTSIQWTDESWNVVTGCRAVSPGCLNCYAARLAATRLSQQERYKGLAVLNESGRGVWSGYVRLHPDRLGEPLRWKEPQRVFVCDMSDLFHEDVPDWFLTRVWLNMAAAGWHTFQVLTRRPERLLDFSRRWADLSAESNEARLVRGPEETRQAHPSGRGQLFAAFLESMGEPPAGAAFPTFDWMEGPRWWPPHPENVWLGVSVEDRAHGLPRIDLLRQCPASLRFLSVEPLLEDLGTINLDGIGWVIVGGESGRHARDFDLAWPRSVVRQCREALVPCFVKQLGKRPYIDHSLEPAASLARKHGVGPLVAEFLALGHSKGGDMEEWPEDLRVREFPR